MASTGCELFFTDFEWVLVKLISASDMREDLKYMLNNDFYKFD